MNLYLMSKSGSENTWLKFIFGSTVFKLQNIKVCYWAMSKICRGARTCFHNLGDICCVGEAVLAQNPMDIYLLDNNPCAKYPQLKKL